MKPATFHPLAFAAAALLHAAASAAPLQITPGLPGNSFGASLSADGNRMAFYSASNIGGQNADGNFEIYLYDRPSNTLQQVTNDTRGLGTGSQTPTISADGSRIVFQAFETRGITGFFRSQYYDVATQQIVSLNDFSSQFQRTDISADGRRIALNRDNDGLRIVDTANGTTGPLLAFNPGGFAMDGNATRLVLDSFSGGVSFVDAVTATTVAISPAGSGFGFSDISDDGSTIAFSSTFDPLGLNADRNQELFVYDVASRRVRQVTNTTRGSSLQASLSADGQRVAFTSTADIEGGNADGNTEIYVYDLLEDDFTQLTRTVGSFSNDASISADGLVVAYTSSADLAGRNPNGIPQIFLQDLAPRRNAVPEPGTLLLAAAALAAALQARRRRSARIMAG